MALIGPKAACKDLPISDMLVCDVATSLTEAFHVHSGQASGIDADAPGIDAVTAIATVAFAVEEPDAPEPPFGFGAAAAFAVAAVLGVMKERV